MPSEVAIACAHELQLKARQLRKHAATEDARTQALLLEKATRFEFGAEALYALIKH